MGEEQRTSVSSAMSGSTPRQSPAIVGSDDVPESLQYQPQSSSNVAQKRTRLDNRNTPTTASHDRSNQVEDSIYRQAYDSVRPEQQRPSQHRQSAPNVPVQQEYDNPLFRAQNRRPEHAEDFALKICDSTSFVHPLPNPPPYSVVDVVNTDHPPAYHRLSGHFTRSSNNNDNRNPQPYHRLNQHPSPQLQHNDNNHIYISSSSSSSSTRSSRDDRTNRQPSGRGSANAPFNGNRQSSSINNNNNNVHKSRPRQVKRENQQRRQGNKDGAHQQHSRVPHGYYSSNPDLSSKSPVLDRRRRGTSVKREGEGEEGGNSGQRDNSRNRRGNSVKREGEWDGRGDSLKRGTSRDGRDTRLKRVDSRGSRPPPKDNRPPPKDYGVYAQPPPQQSPYYTHVYNHYGDSDL